MTSVAARGCSNTLTMNERSNVVAFVRAIRGQVCRLCCLKNRFRPNGVLELFERRKTKSMAGAAFTLSALIYHQTVYDLRTSSRNALAGLAIIVFQNLALVAVFMGMYYLIGIRTSPVRGDFLLFIMSGIFVYMTHVKAVGAVSSSYSVSKAVMKHEPLSAAVLISASALSALYQQVLGCFVILSFYHLAVKQITIDQWQGVAGMFMLAWFSGCCIGMVFLGIRPWAPKAAGVITTLYSRINMFASGKMMVANSIPGFLLPWFDWNPLFHLIDQGRGFMFINYTPRVTDLLYPVWVSIAALMVGLLINFTTRKYESASWGATS